MATGSCRAAARRSESDCRAGSGRRDPEYPLRAVIDVTFASRPAARRELSGAAAASFAVRGSAVAERQALCVQQPQRLRHQVAALATGRCRPTPRDGRAGRNVYEQLQRILGVSTAGDVG